MLSTVSSLNSSKRGALGRMEYCARPSCSTSRKWCLRLSKPRTDQEGRGRDFGESLSGNTELIAPLQRSPLMSRSACFLAVLLFAGNFAPAPAQDKTPTSAKKLPAGVYAVLRECLKEKEVLPLKEGEVFIINRHRYAKKDDPEPPRFLVVRSAPDVELALASKPKAVKEGEEVVRIVLKLQPKAATALERLTADHIGKQIAIVLGGEVVTQHKIREVIKGGEAQITSCAAGAANYLLEQLEAHQAKK